MNRIHLDFETRSHLNVKDCGGWTYSRHPSTDILCMAWKINDQPVLNYTRQDMEKFLRDGTFPKTDLARMAADPAYGLFVAHNAYFEQCIWFNVMRRLYQAEHIPIERWRCTAAKAANMSLPRDLEGVGKALDLPIQKDVEGNKAMLTLTRPRKLKSGIRFWEYEDAPEKFETVYRYNITDVDTEYLVDNVLPELSEREQRLWFLDQRINFTGITVDVPAIQQILRHYDRTVEEMSAEFRTLVNNEFEKPSQVAKLLEWINGNGLSMPDMQAPTIDKVLKNCPECKDFICENNIHRALTIRRALSKTSIAKYNAILDRVDMSDFRLRDILLFMAAITKRWGGRGAQLHNMPRGTVDSTVAIQHMLFNDYDWIKQLYRDLMAMFSSATRGVLTASQGCELFVGDFSAIEAMVLPWLAGDQKKLDVFRENRDPYCEEASSIFNTTVTKADKYYRSVGKVAELALGYNGGIGAFGEMARQYGVNLQPAYDAIWPTADEDEKRRARNAYNMYLGRQEKAENPDPLDRASGYASDVIKQRWRAKNQPIQRFWGELETAAINAVLTGEKQYVGGGDRPLITFGTAPIKPGSEDMNLICRMPSGGCIIYPFVKVSESDTPWGERKYTLSYRSQDSQTWQFVRTYTYGGKLAENITQGEARNLMADAQLRLDDAGYPIVLHVHDEIVADVPKDTRDIKEFEQIMAYVPEWAAGLPVKVEAWKGHRYKK